MKLRTVLLAMAAAWPVASARAADPRVFEGVKLDDRKQTQQVRDMPEVYERDPASRRYRLRTNVVQLPLGTAWITFNPERATSYLNRVPGENAAIYFGPI